VEAIAPAKKVASDSTLGVKEISLDFFFRLPTLGKDKSLRRGRGLSECHGMIKEAD
jgi:hypothetical protein